MPQTCPQCQSEAADGANACPSCGSALSPAPTAAQEPAATDAPAPPAAAAATTPPPTAPPAGGTSPGSTPPAAAARAAIPPYKFDVARWSRADEIAGVATILLFISLFLPWFTISFGFASASVNGLWHGWMYLSLILCIVIVAYLVLRAGWDALPITQEVPHALVMTIATVVNLVLVFIAFIDKPGGSGVGWGFGAVLGLVVAIIAAAPYAVPQLRAKTM
jgi:hypothetical protein